MNVKNLDAAMRELRQKKPAGYTKEINKLKEKKAALKLVLDIIRT